MKVITNPGWVTGSSQDQHWDKQPFTPMGSLELPINLRVFGPLEDHGAPAREVMQTHCVSMQTSNWKAGFKPITFLLWGGRANHCTTLLPFYKRNFREVKSWHTGPLTLYLECNILLTHWETKFHTIESYCRVSYISGRKMSFLFAFRSSLKTINSKQLWTDANHLINSLT